MNGKTNLVLRNLSHVVKGQVVPLTSGKIQLLSEGAEVFYRNIRTRSISELPVGVAQ